MRFLVTGGHGFLGRHVVRRLQGEHEVHAPSSAECDLRERAQVQSLLEHIRPEVVIHLAAVVGGIGANRAHPGRFFYANAIMGLHLMEEARLQGVRKFVSVGTVCVYPRDTPVPFREESLWNGYPEDTNAPYGLAKKMLLVQGQAYRQEYGFNAIYLLPTNLYGPGDNLDLATGHVIPALLRKFSAGTDVTLWGDGSATRDFLYVEDGAEGIVLAAERYDGDEPVNLGSGEEVSIRELAGKVAALTAFQGELRWDPGQPNGQPRRVLDTSRARELFGFTARRGLDDGLRATWEWFQAQVVRGSPEEYTHQYE